MVWCSLSQRVRRTPPTTSLVTVLPVVGKELGESKPESGKNLGQRCPFDVGSLSREGRKLGTVLTQFGEEKEGSGVGKVEQEGGEGCSVGTVCD